MADTSFGRLTSLPQVVQGYNPTVDYLRLAAAFMIVQFHAHGPLAMLGEPAVGFFVIVMVWFTMMGLRRPKQERGPYLRQRSLRLLYPFMVWVALHLLAKIVANGFDPVRTWTEFRPYLPPEGSFGQLWFLPWAVLVSALLAMLFWKRDPEIAGPGGALAGLAVCGIVTLACLSAWSFLDLPLLAGLCILYTPSVVNGVVLFMARQRSGLLLAIAAALTVLALGLQMAGLRGAPQIYVGVPVTILALTVALPRLSWSGRAGTMAMDIYLCHVLVIAVMSGLLGIDSTTVAGSLLCCLGAFAVALVMQIEAVGRWLR